MDRRVESFMMGMVPGDISCGLELSDIIKSKMPEFISRVEEFLHKIISRVREGSEDVPCCST